MTAPLYSSRNSPACSQTAPDFNRRIRKNDLGLLKLRHPTETVDNLAQAHRYPGISTQRMLDGAVAVEFDAADGLNLIAGITAETATGTLLP